MLKVEWWSPQLYLWIYLYLLSALSVSFSYSLMLGCLVHIGTAVIFINLCVIYIFFSFLCCQSTLLSLEWDFVHSIVRWLIFIYIPPMSFNFYLNILTSKVIMCMLVLNLYIICFYLFLVFLVLLFLAFRLHKYLLELYFYLFMILSINLYSFLYSCYRFLNSYVTYQNLLGFYHLEWIQYIFFLLGPFTLST